MNPPLPPYSSAGSEASGPQFLVAQDADMVLALRRLFVRSGPPTAVDRLRLFGLRERLSKVWLRMVCSSMATLKRLRHRKHFDQGAVDEEVLFMLKNPSLDGLFPYLL
jgi:hypothetical protein